MQKYFMRTRMHGTPTGRPDYGTLLSNCCSIVLTQSIGCEQ